MDNEAAWVAQQLREAEATFRPRDINRWNGTSWDYVTIALVADVSAEDRAAAMRLAKKALSAAANQERGLLAALFSSEDTTEYFLGKELPPEPEPHAYGEYQGVKVAEVAEDPHRVERRQMRAAIILKQLEKDPSWRPTKEEIRSIDDCVGIRRRD